MVSVPQLHRRRKILRIKAVTVASGITESGKNAREFGDVRIIISWDRLVLGVELAGTVGIELPKSDGKELHNFASVVLVRKNVVRGRLVQEVAEIHSHAGVERYV